LGAGEGV
jgi:hypothetical protein